MQRPRLPPLKSGRTEWSISEVQSLASAPKADRTKSKTGKDKRLKNVHRNWKLSVQACNSHALQSPAMEAPHSLLCTPPGWGVITQGLEGPL